MDELVKTFDYHEKPQVFAYYPQFYHKTDKDGRPLYIEKLGKIDLAKLRTITTDERMLESLVVEYEKLADPRLPACSRKSGYLLETCCTIFDAKGVGLSNVGQVYGYLQRASAISQNHYPERLGKLYIINAPWGFSGAFAVVKRFLDPVTVAKINILGSGYQKELLAQIPKENLPSEYGGDCKCAGGCELSDEGPCKLKQRRIWRYITRLTRSVLQQGRTLSLPSQRSGSVKRMVRASQQPRAMSAKALQLLQGPPQLPLQRPPDRLLPHHSRFQATVASSA